MPQLPPEVKALSNGLHFCVSIAVETRKGQYGDQEQVTFMEESTGENTRVWISHNNRKQIEQAHAAGFVEIDEVTQEWHVKLGQRVQLVVAGGKIAGTFKAEQNPQPIQANLSAGDNK